MIERLLAADAALEAGNLEAAERQYDTIAAADPRNAIALVGLARVAHRRGNAGAARELAERALAIDADEAAATRLLAELTAEPAIEPAIEPTSAPAAEPGGERRGLGGRVRAWLRSIVGRRP